LAHRNYSTGSTEGELHIEKVLRDNLEVTDVQINDISGIYDRCFKRLNFKCL